MLDAWIWGVAGSSTKQVTLRATISAIQKELPCRGDGAPEHDENVVLPPCRGTLTCAELAAHKGPGLRIFMVIFLSARQHLQHIKRFLQNDSAREGAARANKNAVFRE